MEHRVSDIDTGQVLDLAVKLAADEAGAAGDVEDGGRGVWG